MRSRCEAFEDAIFDHVRFETPLPADALAHIEACAQCARALEEAKLLTGMMLQADCVPPAPDCRSAVMSRISQPQRVFWPAWAYASAGVALASVAIGGILTFSVVNEPGTQQVAKFERPAIKAPIVPKHVESPRSPDRPTDSGAESIAHEPINAVPEEPKPIQIAMAPVDPTAIVSSVPPPELRKADTISVDAKTAYAPTSDTSDYGDRMADAASAPASSFCTSEVTASTMEIDAFAPDTGSKAALYMKVGTGLAMKSKVDNVVDGRDRPVAIAVVNWTPPPAPSENDYSYSYTDLDPHTGQITTCSVERTGDVVNIYLETKPDNTVPSERGSIDNESSTNV